MVEEKQNFKRSLESDFDSESSLNEDINPKSSKILKSETEPFQFKSSIQLIHELPNIQPIKFDLISHEGPAHKPQFKFSLKIELLKNSINFLAIGNSKKQAKTVACLKALNYLQQIPNLFHKTDIDYFDYVISFELKLNNLEKSAIQDNSFMIIKNEKFDFVVESKPIEFDEKTREIIATKNSLMILYHLIPKDNLLYNLIEETGMSHLKQFKVELKIKKMFFKENLNISTKENALFKHNEDEFIFYGFGNSKKLAKTRAAQLCLELMFNIKINNPENELSLNQDHSEDLNSKFKHFSDQINELVLSKYKDLLENINLTNKASDELNQNKYLNVYSAIVQSNGIDLNNLKLICFTTGTKCIGGEFMSQLGTTLNDCHAEILSIRLLRKYLYKKLAEFINHLNQNEYDFASNIFELTKSSKRPFRIKKNINFHLFISSAPCGDSRIFSITDSNYSKDLHPNRKVRGLLRTKIESGMGTIPVNSNESLQTWDGILLGERLKVMSCSDKLCKYNIVGVQGALLSHFLETVYLDSIIVGTYYHKSHLARALYGRISQNLNNLPNGFRINKPVLSTITNNLQRQITKPSNKSMIWSEQLSDEIEVISCKLGKKIDGEHSDVCKYEFFKEWLKLCELIKSSKNSNLNKIDFKHDISYNEAKSMSYDYQKVKLEVYKAFDVNNLGRWVTKPFEQNQFIIS